MVGKFYVYKDADHHIKLVCTGFASNGKPMYIAVCGLNVYSKEWFISFDRSDQNIPTTLWNAMPYEGKQELNFLSKTPCNKPGSKV